MKRHVLTTMLGLLIAVPTFAIVGGELDTGNEFPYVGAIIATDHVVVPTPQTLSTATLVHPRVVMTAGHTVNTMRKMVRNNELAMSDFAVVFTPDAHDGTGVGYRIAETRIHEDFTGRDAQSIDVGLLILEDAVEGIDPVALPEAGLLDDLDLDRGPSDAKPSFYIVGYGTTIVPKTVALLPPGERRVAESTFKSLRPSYLMLSQNFELGEGGLSRGDSGGATLWELEDGTLVQVGVAVFADGASVSYGAHVRTDIQTVIDFIQDAIDDAEAE